MGSGLRGCGVKFWVRCFDFLGLGVFAVQFSRFELVGALRPGPIFEFRVFQGCCSEKYTQHFDCSHTKMAVVTL